MGKKNKKRFNVDTQYEDLRAINKMIESGIIPDSMMESEESVDNMLENLFQSMMKEEVSRIKSEQAKYEVSVNTTGKPLQYSSGNPIKYSNVADQFSPPTERELKSVSNAINSNELKIRFTTGIFKCLTFNDGVKSVSIDLNALEHNEEYENFTLDEAYAFSMIRLTEILTNFYPSAILTRDRYKTMLSKVKSVDTDYFHMFEYPDFSHELLLGYFISKESLDAYSNAINEAGGMHCLYQLLNMLLQLTEALGFSFKNLPSEVVKQLNLTDEFNKLAKVFEEEFLDERNGTVLNNDPGYIIDDDDIPSILPFDYSCPGLIPELNSDTEEDEEDDDNEYEETEDEETEETTEESIESGLLEGLPEEESETTESESTSEVSESEETVYEQFMSNRERVQKRQEQKREKAPQKKSGDDDFIVTAI